MELTDLDAWSSCVRIHLGSQCALSLCVFFPLTLQLLGTTRFSGLEHSDVFSGLHEIRHKSLARVLKQLRVFLLRWRD